jgi:LacI family transcriptional regulator
MKELGYQVNNIARSLKTNKTMTVGFISPELSNDFFMSIAKGAEDEFRKHGYNIIICNSNERADEEKDRISLLCQKCVDGFIIIPATPEGSHYNQISSAGLPVVLVDRLVDHFEADAVLVDNINGSYSVVEYLINRGHRRIGFIGGDIRLTSAGERYEGYRRALSDYCIPVEEDIVRFGDYHVDSGYRIMSELMELPSPPEYVFISNYYMHIGAVKYLLEHKGSEKASTSVAVFDDLEFSGLLGFSSVRVAQPMLEIGRRAAQLLLSRIDGEEMPSPQIIRLKTKLLAEINPAAGTV